MKRGFTLIEMLVSVAIFSVVMVMALGALLSLSVADRKAQALKSAVDNLSFALESMSRTIRTGSGYHCGSPLGQDCTGNNGSNAFYFTANTGMQTAYQLDGDQTGNSQCGQTVLPYGCLERSNYINGSWTPWAPITSPNVVIQDLSATNGFLFHVYGSVAGAPDNQQPMVVLTIKGYVQVSTTQQSAFHLQSVITQRIYDQ